MKTIQHFHIIKSYYKKIDRILILETAGNFAPVLKHYADEQILNPNDQETIDIHEELFTYHRKRHPSDKSDESVRTIIDDQISTTLPNLNAILTSNPESDNSNLIRSLAETLIEHQSLIDRRFNYEVGSALLEKSQRLHDKSIRCAERFETIEKKLTGFDPPLKVSGEVHCRIKNNEDINWHFTILSYEFQIVQQGEIAIMRRPSLESLAVLVDKLIKHPEESSPAKLENICLMVNSLCDEDTNHIWGELYRNFAYQSEELQWSKNHFHEFLPGLLEIITSRSQKYRNDYDQLNSITKDPMSLIDMLNYLKLLEI